MLALIKSILMTFDEISHEISTMSTSASYSAVLNARISHLAGSQRSSLQKNWRKNLSLKMSIFCLNLNLILTRFLAARAIAQSFLCHASRMFFCIAFCVGVVNMQL